MTIKGIIIDDEKSARETLQVLLDTYCPEIGIVATAKSVDEGVAAIQKHRPGIVFLDIQMPRENGFHLFKKIQPLNFEVIFTTAYDQYALRAIRAGAADYLLKPIDILDLQEAVQKTLKRLESQNDFPGLKVISDNVGIQDILLQKLTIPTADGFFVTRYGDIVRCAADRNYTWIFLRNGRKILISKTLKKFEELLPPQTFMRVHKSHIINLEEVIRYSKSNSGIIEMSDGGEIDISRSKKEEFVSRMQQGKGFSN